MVDELGTKRAKRTCGVLITSIWLMSVVHNYTFQSMSCIKFHAFILALLTTIHDTIQISNCELTNFGIALRDTQCDSLIHIAALTDFTLELNIRILFFMLS